MRLRTSINTILKWAKYVNKLSHRKIDFGESKDGRATASHKKVKEISHLCNQTSALLRNRERRAAKRNVFSDVFEAAKVNGRPDPRVIKVCHSVMLHVAQRTRRRLSNSNNNSLDSSDLSNPNANQNAGDEPQNYNGNATENAPSNPKDDNQNVN